MKRPIRLFVTLSLAAVLIGLLAIFLLAPAGAAPRPDAPAAIIRVPDDAASIQAAINIAAPGDEVRVQSGSYFENLVVTKTLALTGGWDGDFTEQGDEVTVVDGGGAGRGLTVLSGVITPSVVISNFRFIHGDATGLGGVIAPPVPRAPKPTLTQAVGNLAGRGSTAGGVAGLRRALLTLAAAGQYPGGSTALDQVLARVDALTAGGSAAMPAVKAAGRPAYGDEVDCGGGVYVRGAALHLIKVYVSANVASRTGGGAGGGLCAVDVPAGGLALEHVAMGANTASRAAAGYGGGLFFSATRPISRSLSLADVAFRDNVASTAGSGYGGGIFMSGAPEAEFNLAVLTSNTATSGGLSGFGGGIFLADSARVALNIVAFQLNTANTNLRVPDPTQDWLTGMGGAIYASNAPDLTLTSGSNEDDPRSIFVGNIAALKGLGRGGALYAENTPRLHSARVRFLGNWGVVYPAGQGEFISGGALYLNGSAHARLEDNDFNNNIAGVFSLEDFKLLGGAIALASSDGARISGNRFLENSGGTAAQGGDAMGGAIDIAYSDAVSVRDNSFTGNVADLGPSGGLGGALHAQRVNDLLIQHNSFVRNRAGTQAGIGGALTVEVAQPKETWNGFTAPRGLTDTLNNRLTISANTFRDNRVALDLSSPQILLGGALASNSVNGALLANNVIADNTARHGAGLALLGWDVEKIAHDTVRNTLLVNNTLVNNRGEDGVYMEMWMTPITLTNNIVVSHTVGLHAHTNAKLGGMTVGVGYTLYNDNGTNSKADEDSTLIESHVITAPVQFVDRWHGNYHLQLTSAARDAGDPAGVPPAPRVDIEGTPRPFGRAVDIGAYEWHGHQMFLPLSASKACFTGRYAGWAIGETRAGAGILLHTDNSGATWVTQGTADDRRQFLSGVSAVDADNAWVTGMAGTILRTRNGGLTWERQNPPADLPAGYGINHISAVSREVAWATAAPGQGGGTLPSYIIHTANGGAKWSIQYRAETAPGWLNWIAALNEKVVYANGGISAGLGAATVNDGGVGRIFRTTDGGLSWQQSPNPDDSVIQVLPINETLAWAAGKQGSILRTHDTGATWEVVATGGIMDHNSVFTFDGREVWVVGDEESIIHTTNGQANVPEIVWETQSAPPDLPGSEWFMDVQFVTNQEGWIAGIPSGTSPTGVILHTTDGGANWQMQPVGAQGAIWHLSMVCGR